jgi:uncharacterized protein
MAPNIKILFHSIDKIKHCPDGFAAAYIAWTIFGESAQYIPVVHQEPPPAISKGDRVYIIDFSYSRQIIEQMKELADITILDHHKTALEELLGIAGTIFNMNKSGAMLAWEYWYPYTPAPNLIRYIQDRDLWTNQLPHTKKVNLALSLFPQDFVIWHTLAQMPNFVDFMNRIGSSLYEKRQQEIQTLIATAKIQEIAGYLVPVINALDPSLISDACNLLCQLHPDKPFAASYYLKGDRTGECWSLRSIGNFDVSAIALKFGGGGHKNAAGFTKKLYI